MITSEEKKLLEGNNQYYYIEFYLSNLNQRITEDFCLEMSTAVLMIKSSGNKSLDPGDDI